MRLSACLSGFLGFLFLTASPLAEAETPSIPGPPPPVVRIDAQQVRLDGSVVASTLAIAQRSYPESKIEELFVELSARQQTWKEAHDAGPTPQVIVVDVGPGVLASTVVATLASTQPAGFPLVRLKRGAEETRFRLGAVEPFAANALHVDLRGGRTDLLWDGERRCADMPPDTHFSGPADLTKKLDALCAPVGGRCFDELNFHFDPGTPFDAVLTEIKAAAASARVQKDDPPFIFPLSVYFRTETRFQPEDEGIAARDRRCGLPEGMNITAAAIRSTIAPRVRQCVDRAREDDPTTEGRFEVLMNVDPSGHVVSVTEAAGGTLNNRKAGQCILDAAKQGTFPPQRHWSHFTAPFVLDRKGSASKAPPR